MKPEWNLVFTQGSRKPVTPILHKGTRLSPLLVGEDRSEASSRRVALQNQLGAKYTPYADRVDCPNRKRGGKAWTKTVQHDVIAD